MKRTELKRKTSFKSGGSQLKRKPLSAGTASLQTRTSLKAKVPLATKTELKSKQKTAKVLEGEYFSIFGPMDVCAISGDKAAKGKVRVVPHHIFGGANKSRSEKYGFILPLRSDWHTGQVYSIHEDAALDRKYKRLCQEYYINMLGKTEEDFLGEFGKLY